MSSEDPIVSVGASRTPMGSMMGSLTDLSATELGSAAIKDALARGGVKEEAVDEVIMGCVLQAGQGQAPARQAALGAGIPNTIPTSTVNKMCGSGMKAVMMACDTLDVGRADTMVAGGLESMTNAPYLLPKARGGYRLGHGELKDHMFMDGLEDAYEGKAMGIYAEETAKAYQFSREQQDAFAIASVERAQKASADGTFAKEVVPVEVKTRKGVVTVEQDEQPQKSNVEKIPSLRPAFVKDGTVTAANSSSISDGGAAVILTRQSVADKNGWSPIARIVGQASNAHEPQWFTTAPVGAIQKLLDRTGWAKDDVDLWEINEAFAVVPMAAMKEIDIPHDKVNVHGGACALGHPIGASGARIIVTLLNAMEKYDQTRGVASLCIGGGEATAVAIERVS